MNTNKLKAYAPKARVAFMEAVKSRAAKLGIFEDRISDITIDGDSAIIEKEVYTRKQGQQRNQLVKRIKALGTHDGKFVHKDGFNQFINETAFTWFNRLTAIRYMEVNEYLDHGFRVLSKTEGAQFGEGFEILNSAADVADELGLNKDQIIDMVLDGNKEEELYRTLLLAQCHQLSEAMPFMFEKLDDATELLLPDNLTKTDSILKDLVNDIPEDNWREIEVIGWLYQFYISEHKDAVIGKVVKREDIPAATQLFTPNWIVKYLVQNSLGRQWLATYPDSELKEKMEYYITPAEQSDDVIEQLKAITPTSIDPEEIKVLDPACGSGHILVEVYEVLREIYLERGYRLREIPELILTKNIYGLDIDDRAAQMAAFAVLMKAREDDKRIFTRDIKLNIHSVQSTENLDIDKLWANLDLDGNKQTGSMGDLFSEPQLELAEPSTENKVYLDLLRYLKEQFIDAKNLGSLVEIDSSNLKTLIKLKEKLEEKAQSSELTSRQAAETLLPIVEQSLLLAIKYNVTVANPPYIGRKYQNSILKDHLKANYPNAALDLFTAFTSKCSRLCMSNGQIGIMSPNVWMFLPTYSKYRELFSESYTLNDLVHLHISGFDGATVHICAYTFQNTKVHDLKSSFIRLADFPGPKNQAIKTLEAINSPSVSWMYQQSIDKMKVLPGRPLSYWLPEQMLSIFEKNNKLSAYGESGPGLQTSDNETFLRLWHEVSHHNIAFCASDLEETALLPEKWYPHKKGGKFRKWYGNDEFVVNWKNNGQDIKSFFDSNPEKQGGGRIVNSDKYFKKGVCWSHTTSGAFSARLLESGFIFNVESPSYFPENTEFFLGIMCSQVYLNYMSVLNPTLHFSAGVVTSAPYISDTSNVDSVNQITKLVQELISRTKSDWDSGETSWNFTSNKLIKTNSKSIKVAYENQLFEEQSIYNEVFSYEEEVNILINELYGLGSSYELNLDPRHITLNSNLHYRFSEKNITEDEQNRYCSENICELLSYYIGCVTGRYSPDREGLVYAHSGNNGFKELVAEGAYKTFPADDDGIVPLADEDWVFADDATTRFRQFVKTVWGEDHLQENLDFVAESLCLDAIKPKKGESSIDTIRRYFSTQFYKDHLKTYKKRPIYWLFSSGKAKAFECLVYLHRYNEGTLSRMRTEYVTPLMGKLESRKNILEDSKATASGAELRAIDKELKTIEKKQAELVTFDEELKHLAEMKISLDLDDGVKVNYGKFGNLLADVKAIHGKNPEVIK
ncbi:BREX-1 system adenine-specific DNA-methyltransferase PglX [Vibrio vulnificus]|nr:BREX-1 system adenine-specific DNA-methyltransferase PglX [Vibrio vulnificus]